MAPILSGRGLVRRYSVGGAEVVALGGVSVDIEPGGLTILRGRSGSGKTTLLNQLCLLDRPDEGEVLFDGEDAARAPDGWRDACRKRHFGIIFQSVALLPQMSALENVDFFMRIAGVPAAGRRARARECLGLVGLAGRATHLPAELSGGEQQRVAIARGIAHRPRVLFADEPTAELDLHMSRQVMKVFFDLIRQEGITVVMTTHDPALMELGDRVYQLSDGVLCDG